LGEGFFQIFSTSVLLFLTAIPTEEPRAHVVIIKIVIMHDCHAVCCMAKDTGLHAFPGHGPVVLGSSLANDNHFRANWLANAEIFSEEPSPMDAEHIYPPLLATLELEQRSYTTRQSLLQLIGRAQ